MDLSNFIREVTISNEYVSQSNKQKESSNHGQSKLKFKSSSPFFANFNKKGKRNKLGANETHDDFTYSGTICFYKKHIIKFFHNIKVVYEKHFEDYKNINIEHWNKYFGLFNKLYKDYSDDDLIEEQLTTTNYRYHEQGVEFQLYQKILFYTAIPYACKIIFYKAKDLGKILIIPVVDFSLLETSYFEKLKNKKFKKIERIVRKSQFKYRNLLLSRDNYCVLSKIETDSVLEAAHIKPYYTGVKKEQSDSNNGLLLTATFHRFFENGYISFDPNSGELLISKYLNENDIVWIKNNTQKFTNLKDIFKDKYCKMQKYIKYHFDNIYIQ